MGRTRIVVVVASVVLVASVVIPRATGYGAAVQQFQTGIRLERMGFADMPPEQIRDVIAPSFEVVVYCDRTRGNLFYWWFSPKGNYLTTVPNGCEKTP